jgi:uncharacterized protein (TIGR02285 family)
MSLDSFRSIFLLLVFVLSGGTPAKAEGRDSVTWMHADFPPLRIVAGPYAGQGPSDMIHELMRREMPDLEHSVLTANLSRTLNWMEKGEKVLAMGIIPSPERDAIMRYSVPCVLVPPACLVVRAENRLVPAGQTSAVLREFVAARRLGVAAGRSYGPEVDAVLRNAADPSRIVASSDAKLFDSLMEMLLLGRVDGVLAYPFEAVYVARMKGKGDSIALVPLREAMVPVVGRIAAPRTAWGGRMIARVDEVLLRNRGNPEYRAAFERWLTPGAVEGYRAMYEDFLLSR